MKVKQGLTRHAEVEEGLFGGVEQRVRRHAADADAVVTPGGPQRQGGPRRGGVILLGGTDG